MIDAMSIVVIFALMLTACGFGGSVWRSHEKHVQDHRTFVASCLAEDEEPPTV